MLCEECGIRDAQVMVTTVVNGQQNRMHLCRECVKKYQKGGDISSLLAAIFTNMAKAKEGENKLCPQCGMSLAEFRKGGLLGCEECYTAFRDELRPVLTRIQGRSQHPGRRPTAEIQQESRMAEVASLRQEMEKAVLEERYEDAAKLRDTIRALSEPVQAGGSPRTAGEEREEDE